VVALFAAAHMSLPGHDSDLPAMSGYPVAIGGKADISNESEQFGDEHVT
jgi:hypothetical protein